MTEQLNMNQLLTTTTEFTTSKGIKFAVDQLDITQWTEMSEIYSQFLSMLCMYVDGDITIDIVKNDLGKMLAQSYGTSDKEAVIKFLSFFTQITETDLNAFKVKDFINLWKVIYEENPVPFDLRLREMTITNMFQMLRSKMQTSSTPYIDSELIPESLELPSITQ